MANVTAVLDLLNGVEAADPGSAARLESAKALLNVFIQAIARNTLYCVAETPDCSETCQFLKMNGNVSDHCTTRLGNTALYAFLKNNTGNVITVQYGGVDYTLGVGFIWSMRPDIATSFLVQAPTLTRVTATDFIAATDAYELIIVSG